MQPGYGRGEEPAYDQNGQYSASPLNGGSGSYPAYPQGGIVFAESSYPLQNSGAVPAGYPVQPQPMQEDPAYAQNMGYAQGQPMQNSGAYGYPQNMEYGQPQQPVQGSGMMTGYPQMGYVQTQGMQGGYPQNAGYMPDQQAIAYDAPVMPMQEAPSIPTPQTTRELPVQKGPSLMERIRENPKPWITGAAVALVVIVAVVILVMRLQNRQVYTAEDVVRALYRRDMPITEPYIYGENTDPDGLLGTRHSYTSKVSFTDTTIRDGWSILERGGIVEVFDSEDDAQVRERQLNNMLPSQSGYVIQENRVVLRLSPLSSEENNAAYEEALRDMFGK